MTISLTGEGVRFTVERAMAAGTRSDGVTTDPVASAISATDGLRISETMSVRNLELTGDGGRGGAGEGAIVVDVGRPDPHECRVVLVEEEGQYCWALPEAGGERIRLAVESPPGSRGVLRRARLVLRVLAVRTVGWAVHDATGTIVGGWDERRHPHRLRRWTPENHRDPNAAPPELRALAAGPALLVIHGFTGSIHGSFGDLAPDVVHGFHRAYGGLTFAFDHPTLAVSPHQNAEWLVQQLSGAGVPLVLDVLAHSRGGLVARELAQRLTGTGVTVRSITFVATPNDGTPLADPKRPRGLLDTLTNLTAAVPGSGGLQLALELVKDIVAGSVLTGLAGLVAMEPSGPYLNELNGLPVPEGLALRAIVADFEPRSDAGVVRTARDRMTDAYFGGLRNDLIVPTVSTIVTSGVFGVRAGQRLVLDSSRGVDHSSFWTNARAVRQLGEWLRPDWPERPPVPVPDAETDPGAEVARLPEPRTVEGVAVAVGHLSRKARTAVEGIVGGPINERARRPTGDRPAVIVIPGIMGTHLRRRTGEVIWIDPVRLMRGHFTELSLAAPADGIEPAGMHRSYLPLVTHLAEAWDVYVAPFDWRIDIRDSANKLANLIQDEVLVGNPTRPVHLVAHSMGGLVARALTVVAPDVWAELGAEQRGDSGRLVMLGTPNRGSFAIVLTLTGSEMVIKALAAVDLRTDTRRLTAVVATFPGVYQMLPSLTADPIDDQHSDLFHAGTWGSRAPVDQALLTDAALFHRTLEEAHQKLSDADLARLISVAGYGHPTPFRVEVGEPGSFTMGRVLRGDGRVALALNHLEGVTRVFCRASHGGLAAAPEVLASLGELLAGRPGALERDEPEFRGAEAIGRPAMIPVERFDPAPTGRTRAGAAPMDRHRAEARLAEALRTSLGGGVAAPERVQVKVGVVHASLEQARFPVAVGHYTGVPIAGAEAFLDSKLGGVLRRRQSLGQYPERAGSAVYVAAPPDHRPHGALVLGLGEFGTLTGATLAEAIADAVIVLVLDRRERGSDPALPATIGLSSVLVGTPGRHGLTIENAVTSMVEGVIEGVARVRRHDEGLPLETVELELIEAYQQPAEEAALLLGRLSEGLAPSLQDQVDLLPSDRLTTGDGHQPGAPPGGGSGDAWVRVLVGLEPDGSPAGPSSGIRRLTFATLARGAQADRIEHDVNLDKLRAYVESAVRRPDQDPAVNRTLYELLFPPRAKLDLDRSEHLHLIVDEDTAQLPWELLAAATSGRDVAPLALRAGMLRQLQSTALTRPRTSAPRGTAALFVGDPPTAYPRLPNAREEAERLASLFTGRGWDVERRIYGEADSGDAHEWMDILNALHQRDYRVVHIAAHGVFDDDWRRSGVALGPLPEHRLTALEFEAMSSTPDLVFLNCCHLGRLGWLVDQVNDADTRALERPHRVAGTVAQQLLRNGVRAVVVAGWAVDDVAAAAFASVLYELMLDGYPLGEAVRKARLAAHEADGGRSNTWGAYQCYGDPDFEMVTRDVPPAPPRTLVSAAQLARELGLAAVRAGAATSDRHCEQVAREVNQLRVAGGELVNDGGVLEALGGAFSELGRYPEAVDAYQQALREEGGQARLRTAEQLANLKVRLAVVVARAPNGSPDQARRLFTEASSTLDLLDRLAGSTAERHALRGSLEKKRATTLEGAEQTEALVRARDAFLTARRVSSPDRRTRLVPYHTNLWLQLAVLTRESGTLTDDEALWLKALHRQVVSDADTQAGYWEAAALADTLLTHVVVGRSPDGVPVTVPAVKASYRKAFALRSTVRQRDSALTHLQDLSLLVPPEQAPAYFGLFESLRRISSAAEL